MKESWRRVSVEDIDAADKEGWGFTKINGRFDVVRYNDCICTTYETLRRHIGKCAKEGSRLHRKALALIVLGK